MIIKLKSLLVIILSSALISGAILLTIFGLSLYVKWKEAESTKLHKAQLTLLNAKLYSPFIKIQGIEAEYEKKGTYKGKCIIKGIIKNNGYRTVSSIKLGVDLLNVSGEVIHSENIFPLKVSMPHHAPTIAALSLFTSGKELPLMPGESIQFTHILSEQKNKNIVSPIKHKRYATNPNEWSGKFNYRITGIRF